MHTEPRTLDRYPASIVLPSNGVALSIYALGVYVVGCKNAPCRKYGSLVNLRTWRTKAPLLPPPMDHTHQDDHLPGMPWLARMSSCTLRDKGIQGEAVVDRPVPGLGRVVDSRTELASVPVKLGNFQH